MAVCREQARSHRFYRAHFDDPLFLRNDKMNSPQVYYSLSNGFTDILRRVI
ncbi:hypothetical protein ALQ29_00619 [Pseudomonas marginalis pv. marginalis]|uniref:Uncharacterized protein n=2 Tax=Pseudomonas marginalis TaxID=298 RepID=A0A3M4A6L7_PSEMA|nr:hypothetical protein ALQ38_04126 [Pseudomonas marginalis pv. marginalis]RMP02543.1 hypothetical protein ALQ29_00619 [Pseudomonas marginalis pv. marginalis]